MAARSLRVWVTVVLTLFLAYVGGAASVSERRARLFQRHRAAVREAQERAFALFLSPFGDDIYYQAVRVLLYWLKQDPLRCSCHPVVVLASQDVAEDKVQQLLNDGALVKRITIPDIQLDKNDISADRWAATMGKLHLFNLTEFQQVVFVDGDFVLFESMDSVFQYGEDHFDAHAYYVAAVPNSWGDTHDATKLTNTEFNSGMMLLKPSETHFQKILALGQENQGKYKMDQALLNVYFRTDGPYPWRPLPPKYNRQFVRSLDDLATDVVAVHEKAFWHHGPEQVWGMWEAGVQAVKNWDAQVEVLTRLRKYERGDLAYRLQTGKLCPRRCPISSPPQSYGGAILSK